MNHNSSGESKKSQMLLYLYTLRPFLLSPLMYIINQTQTRYVKNTINGNITKHFFTNLSKVFDIFILFYFNMK